MASSSLSRISGRNAVRDTLGRINSCTATCDAYRCSRLAVSSVCLSTATLRRGYIASVLLKRDRWT